MARTRYELNKRTEIPMGGRPYKEDSLSQRGPHNAMGPALPAGRRQEVASAPFIEESFPFLPRRRLRALHPPSSAKPY